MGPHARHSGDVEGHAERELRYPLPSAAPARNQGLGRRQMGDDGEQSPGALLHPHRSGSPTAPSRTWHLGAVHDRARAHSRRRQTVSLVSRLRAAARAIAGRRSAERDLDDELRTHLDWEVERNVANGMTPREAVDAARRAFGNIEVLKEESRDAAGVVWLEEWMQDLRHGARASSPATVHARGVDGERPDPAVPGFRDPLFVL